MNKKLRKISKKKKKRLKIKRASNKLCEGIKEPVKKDELYEDF